jgi:hypothetical protein
LERERRCRPFSRVGMGTTGSIGGSEVVLVVGRRRSLLYVVRRRARLVVDRARSKSFKRMVFVVDEPDVDVVAGW